MNGLNHILRRTSSGRSRVGLRTWFKKASMAGAKEAAVRIDTFACAVDQGMTTDELGFLDLGYAPPFASVWDAIAIAANASK